eukprot:847522-Alexandrium_andersonii.AAC.1
MEGGEVPPVWWSSFSSSLVRGQVPVIAISSTVLRHQNLSRGLVPCGGGGPLQEGGHHLPSNYRPIGLLESLYKVFARILATGLQLALSSSVCETQYGCMNRRSTLDAVSLIRRYIELVEERPSNALHLIFIDWGKAFGMIRPESVGAVLRR